MSDCFYCENGEKLRSLMILIKETQYSKIYLNRDQKHPGRCVVQLKDHKTEYFQLTKEEREGYFYDVAVTAKAIWEVYGPDKINYATFGDLVPHVHVHVVPKYEGGLDWGSPFDDSHPKGLLDDAGYEEAVEKLSAKLDELYGRSFS